MKTSVLLALTGASSNLAYGAVQFPFAKQHQPTVVVADRASTGSDRRSTVADLAYRGATYAVNVTVGTPGQTVTLGLSTLASKTWVADARSSSCADDYEYDENTGEYVTTTYDEVCLAGTFSPGNSTTFAFTNPSTSTYSDDGYSYGDDDDFYDYSGSYSYYGRNITDVFSLGESAIQDFTIGLVNESSYYSATTVTGGPKGVLGLGYNDSISSSDNLPLRLLEQGLINTTAYSIWVDDQAGSSGSVLFGAIDTAKYTGNLTRLRSTYSGYEMMTRVVSINGTTSSGGPYAINSTGYDEYGYSSTSSDAADSYLFSALYSPSDIISILPTTIASQMWDMAGAYYDPDVEQALIGCTAASDDTANFTFQLGSQEAGAPIISVSMADLVIPASEFNVSYVYGSNSYDFGDNKCLFGVQNSSSYYSSSSDNNLGNSLLRRVYSVFDLVNNEIAIAPVVFGASAASNVVAFESYGATVPLSTLVCSSSYCSSSTGSDDGGTDGADGSEDEGRIGSGRSMILSLGALLGLVLGLAFGFFALGLVGFLVYRRRWKKKFAAKGTGSVSSAEAGQPEMSSAVGGHTNVPEVPREAPPDPSTQHTVEDVDKGQGQEAVPPLPPRARDGQPEGSRAAEVRAQHGGEGLGSAL